MNFKLLSSRRAAVTVAIGSVLLASANCFADAPAPRKNLAADAAYQCTPAPNYWGWKGRVYGDKGQLADGRVLDAWTDQNGKEFYARPGAAGWTAVDPVVIVFDLGKIQPIGGIGLHSVLSPWGPWWPQEVAVLVSDDNTNFYLAGSPQRMTPASLAPPLTEDVVQAAIDRTLLEKGLTPTTHWHRMGHLAVRARYVALIMTLPASTGSIVLDEIEIYEGATESVPFPRTDQVFTEGPGGVKSYLLYCAMRKRVSADLTALRQKVVDSSIPNRARENLSEELDVLESELDRRPIPSTENFRAVLPIDDLHRRVFGVHAAFWRARGHPSLRVWHTHRWDPLSPLTDPVDGEPKLRIVIEQNAVRSDVLNLSSAAEQPRMVSLRLTEWPEEQVELFEVPLVDTRAYEPVAAALLPLTPIDGVYRVNLIPGMTHQIWIRCRSKNRAAGKYEGKIVVTTDPPQPTTHTVATTIEVAPVRLPDQRSLLLGGWDYSIPGLYEVTPANQSAYIAMLREYGVNVTWSNSVMPTGTYDAQGNVITEPSRTRMSQWLKQWPDANLFCVVGDVPVGSDETIAAWAADWSRYLQSRGVPPEKLAILIRDEPTTEKEVEVILRIGRAIRQGEPRFRIFNDFHFSDPNHAPAILDQAMRETCDLQYFNLHHYLSDSHANRVFMDKHRRTDLQWGCYTGNDNRLSDPYIARALRPWFCFANGMNGAHWWAFGDGGGGFSWNEYLNQRPSSTPLYLSEDSVATSKFMEAMREGAQDYELLTMLKKQLAAWNADRSVTQVEARRILNQGIRDVLSVHDSPYWPWRTPKDRSTADRVRKNILRVLSQP